MALEIKPTAEDIEPEVWRPGLFISEPTRQLRNENLLAQFAQDFVNILFRITLRDQVDRRLPSQVTSLERESAPARPRGFFTSRAGLRTIHSLLTANSKNAFTVLMFFAAVTGLTCHDWRNSRTSIGPHWSSMTYPFSTEYALNFFTRKP